MDQDGEENEATSSIPSIRNCIGRLFTFIASILRHFVCCPDLGQEYLPRVEIERNLAKPEARLLVLGASDTGKSTFMRQMRLEFGDQYPIAERSSHQPHIRRNVFESVHKLVTAAAKYKFSYGSLQAEREAAKFIEWLSLEALLHKPYLDSTWSESIEILWKDAAIQKAYTRRNEFHLMTNADYFISNAARILSRDYLPSVDDILRMRYITRGAVTKTFDLGDLNMTMHDMGGQRLERRTWTDQLDNPSAILFLASLSEYDQTVEEATECKNRVQESLDIYEELLDYSPFENTPVILLLNKTDIFRVKIREQSLKKFFPGYKGPEGDEIKGRDYIASLYAQITTKHKRNLLIRYSEATNRENFRAIFSFVRNYVARKVMGEGGLF